MSWWNRRQSKKGAALRESVAVPIVEPGELTMNACIARFEGTEVMDPAAFCQYQRINRIGYFAKGYTGGLESMKEKDRAAFCEQMRDAVNRWNGMKMSERAMWRPENDAILKTSHPSGAHGGLMRADVPRGMESERGALLNLATLAEAKVDRKSRSIRCAVISEGKGNARDNRYYGPEAVEGVAEFLDGARSFINHAGPKEEAERPEGDLWDQCGFWKNAKVVEVKGKKAVKATLVCDKSAAGDEALAKAEAAIEYAREFPGMTESYAGISINGQGEIEEREVDGETVNYVTEVTALPRADVVTQPARGGQFLGLVESIRSTNNTEGVRIMNEALRKELARFAESLAGVAADTKGDTSPDKVLSMLNESVANITKLAKAQDGKGGGTTEAETPADEEEEAEESEEEEKEEGTEEAEEEEEEEEEETEESGKGKKKGAKESTRPARKVARESAAERENVQLRKDLKESKRRLKSVEGKVALEDTAKAIKEAGLDGLVDAKDLAEIPPSQRAVQIKILKGMREASPFGAIHTTLKGAGSGDSSKPGAGFMTAFKTATGNRA